LTQTTFPTLRISLPPPFPHGYQVRPGKPPQDVTTFLSPSGAWASGAIVSTSGHELRGSGDLPLPDALRHFYCHTGNFPGYVQWAAATADGRRSVARSLNIAKVGY
jgi:D-alanyl-D-alanine carboxypeptidase